MNARQARRSWFSFLAERKDALITCLGVAAMLCLVAGVYWVGLTGGYAFDDFHNIVQNPALRTVSSRGYTWVAAAFSSPASELQRPLSMLSFAVNSYFTGQAPWPMKATNLAIHLCNTALVFALSRSLLLALTRNAPAEPGRITLAAWLAAAMWGLHPINLTAVLYIVQRMESLCHLFVFAGLWLYVAGRSRQLAGGSGWPRILSGLLLGTGLGTLAKESAALLPLYALLVELFVFRFRGRDGSIDRRLLAVFGSVLILPGVVGLLWLVPKIRPANAWMTRDFNLEQRLLTEARVIIDYLRWIFVPDLSQFSLFHDDYEISRSLLRPPGTAVSLLALIALVASAWSLRKRWAVVALGISLFLAAHLLTGTIIPLELVYEHRNYFASFGPCLAVAYLLVMVPRSNDARRITSVIGISMVVLLALQTHLRAWEWRDSFHFAASEAEKRPLSPRATYELARVLIIASDFKTQSPYFDRAMRAAVHAGRVPGSHILPETGAVMLAARSGTRVDPVWWQQIREKLRRQGMNAENTAALIALNNCVVNEKCDLPREEMIETFSASLARGPSPGALSIYGKYALHVLRDPVLALRLWQDAARLDPANAQFSVNLATLLTELGRRDEAETEINRLRRLGVGGQFNVLADQLEAKLAKKTAGGARED